MGNIQGEYVSLEENKQIVMKWKMKDWNEYSDVTLTFDEGNDVRKDRCLILYNFAFLFKSYYKCLMLSIRSTHSGLSRKISLIMTVIIHMCMLTVWRMAGEATSLKGSLKSLAIL